MVSELNCLIKTVQMTFL